MDPKLNPTTGLTVDASRGLPTSPEFSGGLVRIAGPEQVAAAVKTDAEAAIIDLKPATVDGLKGYLMSLWDTNLHHKERENTNESMVASLQARKGEYDESKLASIKGFGGSDVYMGLTGEKCRAAESWILDVMSSANKPWTLQNTPVPTVPEHLKDRAIEKVEAKLKLIAQNTEGGGDTPIASLEQVEEEMTKEYQSAREDLEAEMKERTQNMEDKIHDQMLEGGWDEAFEGFVGDLVTLKAGVIKGPIARLQKKKEYIWNEETKKNDVKITEVAVPEYERVSPFDLFPAPDASTVNEGALVERVKLDRAGLVALKSQPGYITAAVDKVLEDSEFMGYQTSASFGVSHEAAETSRLEVEGKNYTGIGGPTDQIRGLEFWCSVQGKLLKEIGLTALADGTKVEDLEEYQINAITINTEIIYASFNDDPLDARPYNVWGWTKIPGAFWFEGVPELMSDIQSITNASARALVNNLAIASGPQAEVDVTRLLPGEPISSIAPFKIWQTTNRGNNASPALRFFQPSSNAAELLKVYDRFTELADGFTGIPAYAYGNDKVAGAGRTSSGLSMLMSSSAKGIKRVMISISSKVFAPIIQTQFDWNKQYLGDEFKGDINIVPTGIISVMVREQMATRRTEFLQTTNNEFDMKILGIEGRAAVLRETVKSLEIPGDAPARSERELRKIVQQDDAERESLLQQQQNTAQAEAQAAEAASQAAQMDLQIKQIEMQGANLDNQAKVQTAQMEQVKLQLEIRVMERDSGLKAQELDIKGTKVQAEAAKDYAVAGDISSRNLMDAEDRKNGVEPGGDKKKIEDSGELNTEKGAKNAEQTK